MAIRVGTEDPESESNDLVTWNALGHMRFDSNERSEFCARELKSVHVKARGSLLHFSVQRCHINSQNIYNQVHAILKGVASGRIVGFCASTPSHQLGYQSHIRSNSGCQLRLTPLNSKFVPQVGILAINLIGEPLPDLDSPAKYLETVQPFEPEPIRSSAAASAMADLVLDVSVDPTTASKIRDVAAAKDAAVMNEDYDEAKRLKLHIEKLKVLGQHIASLEAKKRAAVDCEDYDAAKHLKADILKLRMAGESTGAEPDSPTSMGSNPDQIFNRVLGKKPSIGRRSTDMGSLSTSCNGIPDVQDDRYEKQRIHHATGAHA